MTALLATCGLLMVASIVTLLVTAERSWFLSIARGIGVQSLIAVALATFMLFFPGGKGPAAPTFHQTTGAVSTVVYNAGGWTAGRLYTNLKPGTPPAQHPEAYLPIVGAQVLLVSILLAWRKMRDEAAFDAMSCLLVMLVLANSVISVALSLWWP